MASNVVVVMVPFVAQGHLNQLLHLSRLISAYNIPIHFISTTTHNRQARLRLHGWNPNNIIQFHDLPDPIQTIDTPTVPDANNHFPTHLQPLFNSSLLLRGPVTDLIHSLSQAAAQVVVIHDALMSYVVHDVDSIPNVAKYVFRPLSVFYYFCLSCDKLPFDQDKLRQLPALGEGISQEFKEFIQLQNSHQTNHVGEIYDSSRVIEGKFIESIERKEDKGKRHWALGPFNQVEIGYDHINHNNRHTCLQWLDKQPPSSVIYVSFGTTTTFTRDQITELAIGLERSEQRFLWVLREADKGDNLSLSLSHKKVETLPQGFEERVVGRGLVVREWAPQVEILGHVSTGGFLSHCGWNSCMEAMITGVAVASWPIHTDQPYNAFLLSNVLGVAVVMRDWERRDELLTSLMVEKVVKKLMDTDEGAAIRKRARELSGELRRSMADGGVSREELNSFISTIRN